MVYGLVNMAIEIEKKYRLTGEQRERVRRRLGEIGGALQGEEFEENTIYGGGNLSLKNCVLRLRRVGDEARLTYKERFPSSSAIKRQLEEETRVESAKVMAKILEALGFKPTLVYEKRRETWRVAGTEVVLDQLPFGLFMEIEGDERAILEVEQLLNLTDTEAELATYPQLTRQYGKRTGDLIEARFENRR
jgi:adenylate cyclase class 2